MWFASASRWHDLAPSNCRRCLCAVGLGLAVRSKGMRCDLVHQRFAVTAHLQYHQSGLHRLLTEGCISISRKGSNNSSRLMQ